ncbi:c-type cytochrome [Longispora albida]|uniref:cytochrome bc1 complex diheme cytochrome c subunit n=1 Tax=Longispora albida TaxID=203523 RepID=UPI00036773CA|nr:c-type cytochrome [Longispora albida]
MTSSAEQPRRVPGKLRRRLGAAARMLAALALAGGVYAAIMPASQAEDAPKTLSARAQEGKALYDVSCISCHGTNAEGVKDRGPSLIGVGSAAVEFQVSSGRMPMAAQGAQAERKAVVPLFEDPKKIEALGQYIQEIGGGPQLPGEYGGGDPANGGRLFRVNCAQCHGYTAGGGALSSGKFAPPLDPANSAQLYGAMLTGPQNMPVFGDNQLTVKEKKDIIAYVEYMKNDMDPGGYGLGRIGPATEGIAIFVVGITLLVFTTLWIAGKS